MTATLLRSTIDISLLVQWVALIVGLVASAGTSGVVAPLGTVLAMENVVQVIEIAFYHWYRWVAGRWSSVASGSADVAWVRYLDWALTTPVMLISTALFFVYQRRKVDGLGVENGVRDGVRGGVFSLWEWLATNQSAVWAMVLANGIMLLIGFLQEMDVLDIITSSTLGFAALGVSFWILWRLRQDTIGDDRTEPRGASSMLVGRGREGGWLYPFMFVVWSMYGVAAMFPVLWKNVAYNILDLFSKNFYGLYVSWLVLTS